MKFQEFEARYKEVLRRNGLSPDVVSKDELNKMFISHMVVSEWDVEQLREKVRREALGE